VKCGGSKEIWRSNRVGGGRPQNNGGVEEKGKKVGEDGGLRKAMGFRAGRIESWCDPVDGSIQGGGLEWEREQVQVGVEKRGKGGVEFLPGDSELARPKTVADSQRPPKVSVQCTAHARRWQLQQGAPASPD
jgi:hypothetical protein